jgi:hypothetical protein
MTLDIPVIEEQPGLELDHRQLRPVLVMLLVQAFFLASD